MKSLTFVVITFTLLFGLQQAGLAKRAKKKPAIKTGYVKARQGESILNLLGHRLGIPKDLLYQKSYLRKIKKWNPSIENFKSLNKGQKVYVEIPYSVKLTPGKSKKAKEAKVKKKLAGAIPVAAPAKKTRTVASKAEKPKSVAVKKPEPKKELDTNWHYSAFYAYSKGIFEETVNGQANSTISHQNSPVTLGIAAFKKFDRKLSYSGSIYLSQIESGVFYKNQEVDIPTEFGLTSYAGYQKENWPVEIYSGLDIEKLSSYNMEELDLDEPLSVREHTLFYLTVGMAKSFELASKRFLFKTSISKSILSKQSRPSLVTPDPFSGFKFIAFLTMKVTGNWSANLLYKQHNLEGATTLRASRLGVGLGYSF
jgi:hypothetical protein